MTIGPIDSLAAAVDELLLDILAYTPRRGQTLRDQGMDSMASARLWIELRARLGVELPLEWLATEADPDRLVMRIAEQRAVAPPAVAERLDIVPDPEHRTEPFPLTAMQQSYVLGMHPECTSDPVGCEQYLELEVRNLDVERLAGAWRRLVERHDVLRSVLTADGMQRVVAVAPQHFVISVHDLRELPPEAAAGERAEVRRQILQRRDRDPDRPAFAIEVTRCEPVSVVHVSIDMRITDAHGLAVLLAEWRTCYEVPEAALPEHGIGVRDCVVALCERSRGAPYRADLAWWTDRLRGLPPGPRGIATQPGPRGPERRSLESALSAEEFRALRGQADAHQVSPSALILAVFARALEARGRGDAFSLVVTTNLRTVLPAGADPLVGPFTSAAIIVVGAPRDPIDVIARDLQHQLWGALQHTGVSCVEVLRELRGRDRGSAIASPVVFTSLLGVGPSGRQDLGFGADVTFGACRTAEVALELQIWQHGEELRFRWDLAAGRFAPGDPELLFAGFANALRAVAGMTATYRPLNDLQQAYYVARASGPDGVWNGCQIYASFDAAVLDPHALEGTLAALVDRHAALRTNLTADGRLAVWTEAPARWTIPVIDLESPEDAAAIAEDMVSRAFVLGAWPAFDVRLTRCAGSWTVHCAFDLAILDARSIHLLCRELFTPRRLGVPQLPPAPPDPDATAYWCDRLARLPPGPALVAGDDRGRIRLEARTAGWGQLAALAAGHDVAPDMLLLAAFLDVLAGTLCDRPFTVPVVRFTDSRDELRPGELTSLSWVEHTANGTLTDQATTYHRVISGDPASGTSGLSELRRRVMHKRGSGEFAFPVVYTTIVDLDGTPLPPGITQGPWLSCTPDVSLDCIATRDGDELFVCWDAVAADFAPGVLETMFARYRRAVEQLAQGPAAPRPAPDREQTLYAWNATAWPVPRDRLAHQLFEHHAARAPAAIALRGRGWVRSYGELNLAANRIARRVVALGGGPDTVVGVALPRGPDMVAACLGILKAGAAYLPVEPTLPAERAAQLLSQARAGLVLTTSGALPWPVPAGTRPVEIDRLPDDAAASANLPPRAAQGNLAYVIFTSGSTGAPKGVAVAHRAVVNLLQWCHRTFEFGPGDTGLCVTPLGFDLSVFDILGVLGSGGTLYVADEDERADPQRLLEVLLAERVTFWNSAPALLAHMAPLLPAVRGAPGTSALRLVFLSGDTMPLALPGELRAAFPGARVVNLGGATEATVWSNAFVVDEVDPSWRSIPYGRPIDNARYHVLDERGEPCLPDVEGDLYIGGECLAEGYHGRPDLTAERFVPDPFARQPGQRLYRTGDRAAYRADGVLQFLGRRDRQVKIRGFRIELEEIEHQLRRHPGVRDAAVVARPDASGDRKLVAYVLAAPGAVLDGHGVRAFAGRALPGYMVPNLVALLEAFPTTPNGKLDRNALPWPLAEPPAAPADPPAQLVDEIASLFAGLLGVPRFDPAQDIWYQGATSFTVVQVSQALYARHGRRIPVSAVIAEPTATGIARWLAAERVSDPAAARPAMPCTAPPPVDYFSAEDQRAFRDRQWGLRPSSPGQRVVALPPPRIAAEYYIWRSSRRDFLPGPVPYDAFCCLLALLAQAVVGERIRRLYPSAGDTYAVQVYAAVRRGGVDSLAPGIYYYHPIEHALHCVRPGVELDRTSHHASDRAMFDAAAFELHLIGESRGIDPLYREHAERYLAVEAGHISQLLMMGQAACGIGLCPIGELAFARVRDLLGLEDRHRFLLAMLGGRAEWPRPSTTVAPVFAAPPLREVAIVGIAGRYPGADDPEALWQQLVTGRSAIARPPQHRGLAATGSAALLDRIDEFDSLLFRIAPAEAETLDPQLRLLLETVRACLDDAGHSSASLQRASGRVGVVVAAMWQDYQQVGAESWARGGEPVISASASDIAHRISQCFDFRGPSLAIDAGCTSSVAALHLAVETLRRGECGAVIVGAVNLLAHPYHLGVLSGLGLSAPECRGAFDAAVSGWIPGEGVAAVLLRPAAAALADGDVIHGVIEATALGHSGRNGAIDAAELASSLSRMLAEHHVPPSTVSYVECAAAGASVSDAAELEALGRVFGESTGAGRVMVGTLKPNIGHLEAAAGLSQLTKVVLQMRHGQIAPTRIAPQRNPLVGWDTLPIQLVDQTTAWACDGGPVRAVINTLGAGGAFGHLVVRAAPTGKAPPAAGNEPRSEHVVVLSAASQPQLIELARRLRDRLATSPCELEDLAYTLQTASADLPHRAAVPGLDITTILRRLAAFIAGQPLDAAVTGAAAAWLRGEVVDWPWPHPARRLSLPAYPFARRRHWSGARGGALEDRLLRLYAEVSGIAEHELDPHVPIERYGLSSLLARRLHARLERELGSASPTLFYEHATLAEIAARLEQQTAVPQPVSCGRAEPRSDDIAIIGIAGRYPGARDLVEFWANLTAGRDCITPLPAERCVDGWPIERMWGGYLDGIDQFDAPLFNITPRDADLMDPQERVFLETAWQALDDAGYPRTRLRERHGSRVGVWVGSMYNEYPFFGVERSLGGEPVSAGAGLADIANRVSYFFDLRGPSMTVDTLCSSSLTSLHLAVESLRRGECEVAIAGGVNLSLHPNKFVEQARHGMPSSDHRCRSFGARGDGFVPGEGAGAVVLKPLHAAIGDGDRIHAVIKATAVNHGGRGNGYMVPSPTAQAEVVHAALAAAGVPASTIGYMEAHGTGTELGDPIEIAGLERAFAGHAPPLGHWPIGSVKSSIGHLEGAAGIAGLTKVILQLRAMAFAPSLHAEELNPAIDWDRSPFRVQRSLAPWPVIRGPGGEPLPRRAGISSFGAGGANAHAIVEEYVAPPDSAAAAPGPQLVVLSALDEARLRAAAQSLAGHFRADRPVLADVAYTLQVGREHLRERLALVASSIEELSEALERFAAGDDRGAIRGRAVPGATVAASSDLAALGRAWVAGGTVDWSTLHGPRRPKLVGLPSYPFERRRHWVPWAVARKHASAPTIQVYWKTWIAAEGGSGALGSGPVVCLFDHGSEAVAHALACRLGSRAVLWRDAERDKNLPAEELAECAGWIDLCDFHRRSGDPGPWRDRLALLRRMLDARRGAGLRVLHVTSGLQDPDGAQPNLAGARVAGLVRMLRAEQRQVAATTLDIDAPMTDPAEAARQIAAELEHAGAPEVCRRGGRRLVPALRRTELVDAELRLAPDRVYVVTGGTRGLGALVARRLVERGARRLALMGSARSDDRGGDPALPMVRELEAAGAEVLLYRGPLDARRDLDAFLARARGRGDIGGIVHCAGSLPEDRRPFFQRGSETWGAVYGPKVDGLELLGELCERDRPEFFVLFSSIAGWFPALAAGAAEYAAASAFLDWFAAHHARTGRPWFRSVAWPSWRGGGSAVTEPAAYLRLGLDAIDVEAGLRLFEAVAAAPSGGALLVDAGGAHSDPSHLLAVADEPSAPAPPPATRGPAAPLPDRAAPVPVWLTELFADSLGAPPSTLAPDVPFADLGVESILLAELLEKIEAHVGRPLAPTLLLDHPTLASLAAALGPARPAPPSSPAPRAVAAAAASRAADHRIAIIGASCRFPGAPDLDAFWAQLREGGCAIADVPAGRWRADLLYRPRFELGKTISKWGGFLDAIEDFDPGHFAMTDEEATCLDPAVRLMLEGVEQCLADAGYTAGEVGGRAVGVFAGARVSDYWRRTGSRTGSAGFGADQNFIAARIAHHLDLGGPCLVVDSACSSSLVAVQLAAHSLLTGESELAFATGVEVLLDERPYLEFSAARALSPSGRCRVFDERADGFVPGEGCGVVLLKRLDRALSDGDRIRAVIEAVAVNNDGRTVGLTTPNPAAQAAVVLRALEQAGRTSRDIAMIEAHGTGTTLGDPIELRALTDAFAHHAPRPASCAIGSVKSNIGHLLSAAGIAGLLKVMLALERGEIPPTLFCERPNPRFDFARSPFYPSVDLRPWPDDRPRVAGVSAFGLGGTNAHLIASAPDPEHQAAWLRHPLPPPRFRRRRLWLDREPAPARSEPAPRALIASILDLQFLGGP